eukprot:COSAG02_NODE_10018_length_2048_cov_0.915341_2_plen_68_part_00
MPAELTVEGQSRCLAIVDVELVVSRRKVRDGKNRRTHNENVCDGRWVQGVKDQHGPSTKNNDPLCLS